MVEHCDIFGKLDRIDPREIQAYLSHTYLSRVLRNEIVPEQRIGRRLDANPAYACYAEAVVTEASARIASVRIAGPSISGNEPC